MQTPPDLTPDIVRAASAFAALGSEQRLTVLGTLVRAGPDGLSMGELGSRSGITGSTLTHHIRILIEAGLVNQAREGRRVICVGADYATVAHLSEFLLRQCCADAGGAENTHG